MVFPFGSSFFHNKENNSSMKTLFSPWNVFKFNNSNMVDNMLVEDPSNNRVDALINGH
jgi:hypothetical protein